MMRFSALLPQVPGISGVRPSEASLKQLAAALQARGCKILDIGRFAVSVEASDELFQQLQQDKGKDDLTNLGELEVAPPPIFFGIPRQA